MFNVPHSPVSAFQYFSLSAFPRRPAFKVQGSRFEVQRFNGSGVHSATVTLGDAPAGAPMLVVNPIALQIAGSALQGGAVVLAGRREGLSIQSHIISMSALTHPPVET